MIKKLPLIELLIDPENNSFVSAISLVANPAIESSFIAFSEQKPAKGQFNFSDEKMELMGIAMKANVPIYRNDPQMGEFAVVFSAQTIRDISLTFAKNNFNKNLNLEHSITDAGCVIFQTYIVNSKMGVNAPTGIDDANDGDWIVGIKVEDPETWKQIKSGKISGFSIEGIFDLLDTEKIIDFQFNKLQPDSEIVQFSKELEEELDALILKYNL